MRKLMPCKNCGVAKLKGGNDYVLTRLPACLYTPNKSLWYRCACGLRTEIDLRQFNSLQDMELTVS